MIKDYEELCDVIDGLHDDWEVVQEDQYARKHDCTNYCYLLKYKKTGELYIFDVDKSYNYGIDPDDQLKFPLTFDRAEIVSEITKYKYRIKKDS